MQALGNSFYTMLTSLLRQIIVLLPAAFLFSRLFGLNGTWLGWPCAEVASLIAPRPFFADEGDRDDLFDYRAFLGECERTVPFFEAAGAKENFKYRTFDGTHEFAKDDEGIAFVYNAIK